MLKKIQGVEITNVLPGKIIFILEQQKQEFHPSLQFINEKMLTFGYAIKITMDIVQ